jgi:hypothetical protein
MCSPGFLAADVDKPPDVYRQTIGAAVDRVCNRLELQDNVR